jgi:hypothetical protein
MSSVMQGSYPSDGPEVLGPDAMKAADAEILAQLAAAPARKPRGRPAGSRNRPKVDDSGNFVPPGRRRTTTEPQDETSEAELQRKIAVKKRLAGEYERKILEGNEALLGFLIQNGVAAGLLYKNGQPPNQGAKVNPNWTDLANQLAIPPHLAKVAGYTAAEIQSSTIGTSVISTLEGDSPIRLLVLLGATLVVGVPYLRNLNEIRKRMVAAQQAVDQYNMQQARAAAPPMQVVG